MEKNIIAIQVCIFHTSYIHFHQASRISYLRLSVELLANKNNFRSEFRKILLFLDEELEVQALPGSSHEEEEDSGINYK